MFRTICASALVAAMSAAPALAMSADHMISSIDVEFDLESIESPVAAEFWADLEGDLEEAIATRITDHIAKEGAAGSEIVIDIDEFEMSNSFQAALGVNSVLMGDVDVTNEADPAMNSHYALRVPVEESGRFETTDDGIQIVTHDREEVYQAIVDTFANGVVKRLR